MSREGLRPASLHVLAGAVFGLVSAAPAPLMAAQDGRAAVVESVAADPEIVLAAQRNDLPGLQALIAGGADVNAVASDETTALIWAAAGHHVEMADILLQAGADPDIVNDYGVGALDLAAATNDAAMIQLLLAAGADPNTARWSGETPLMHAARAGGHEAVEMLVAARADLDARERRGQTALMWAAAAGRAEAVKRLLAAGADLKAATPAVEVRYPTPRNYLVPDSEGADTIPLSMGGWAPIHFAARAGHKTVVQLLLEAGEDIDRPTEEGATPLIAALYRHELLDVRPPYDVEVFGDLDTAEFLLRNGANPNAANRSGLTPLHAAVFIAAGKDRWSYALDEDPAITPHDTEGEAAIRLLLAHGADPNLKIGDYLVLIPGGLNRHHAAYKNITPFLLAGALYKDQVQELMLASGRIDVDAREPDGATLLMQAAMLNSVKTAKMLIEAGADVNAVDDEGRSALHFAAMQPLAGAVHAGYPGGEPGPRGGGEMVETLVAAGAEIEVKDRDGLTPLDIARMSWPNVGLATGHVLPNAPQVFGFFVEENQLSRNFSPPAQRLSAEIALERAMERASPAVASTD